MLIMKVIIYIASLFKKTFSQRFKKQRLKFDFIKKLHRT